MELFLSMTFQMNMVISQYCAHFLADLIQDFRTEHSNSTNGKTERHNFRESLLDYRSNTTSLQQTECTIVIKTIHMKLLYVLGHQTNLTLSSLIAVHIYRLKMSTHVHVLVMSILSQFLRFFLLDFSKFRHRGIFLVLLSYATCTKNPLYYTFSTRKQHNHILLLISILNHQMKAYVR